MIGAGPVGLAAAAHLASRGIEPLMFEAGDARRRELREWGHVRVFSPWEYNVDPAAARLLAAAGWTPPDADAYPTGDEIVERYLEPLAALPAIAPALQLGARVVAVTSTASTSSRTPAATRRRSSWSSSRAARSAATSPRP